MGEVTRWKTRPQASGRADIALEMRRSVGAAMRTGIESFSWEHRKHVLYVLLSRISSHTSPGSDHRDETKIRLRQSGGA
jgi:hypothetical protein